ncbi:Os10g0174751, partial [Oryza sativa Japonica Group]
MICVVEAAIRAHRAICPCYALCEVYAHQLHEQKIISHEMCRHAFLRRQVVALFKFLIVLPVSRIRISEEEARWTECVVAGDLEAWKEATALLRAEREGYADVAALVDAAWKCYRRQRGYMLICTSS